MFKGIAASPGIVIGKVFVLKEQQILIREEKVSKDHVAAELKRLNKAIRLSSLQLGKIRKEAEEKLGKGKAGIFDAHLMVLEDETFLSEIKDKIQNEYISAEYSVFLVVKKYIETFNNIEDEYLKERAADIRDIGDRLMKNILGIEIKSLDEINEEVVIIARDLTPSDTAQINRKLVKAFAVDMGGKTSHTAIMARSLEIPAVVGLSDISSHIKDGDTVIVDGNQGLVYINPDDTVLDRYRELRAEYLCLVKELSALKEKTCETKCHERKVEISANIGTPKDCSGALANGAEGIGLYRTEFLYMDKNRLPDEEEQFEAYKVVAETMAPHPVVIRTLDIGGDKKLSYLDMPDELNPFLGWRAIRFCLDRTDILKTQLRAILRASHYGNLRIMYPMISNAEEIRKANTVLKQAKEELAAEGTPYDNHLQVGIMVEIPSAAITADLLAQEVDFFSIGTNDLIQYTIAVDRMNERISHLYEPFHPAVLRLIKNVIDASHRAGKWTGLCGEMAGDVTAVPILLGMGLDEFSMSAVSIPRVKKVIRSLSFKEAQDIAQKALEMDNPTEIRELVKRMV